MPSIVYEIINLLASILRLLGMAAFGVGIGWLALDLLRKSSVWQVQMTVFLGLVGLAIALVVFLSWGALGGFGLGFAAAVFAWGMPKKAKADEE
jgi:hypothetical protein